MRGKMLGLSESCPVCGEGHLEEKTCKNEVRYKEEVGNIPLHFSICDVCGIEQGNAVQIRKNKREMVEFKRGID